MIQLRALVAVEHCSSYASAAEQIGLSQPAVYRAVRELQDALGAQLLVRAGRVVRPTDLASRFVRFVRLMLSELRTRLDEIAADKHGGGRISIGTLPMARAVFLPDFLALFAQEHPGASVEVREAPYGELLIALQTLRSHGTRNGRRTHAEVLDLMELLLRALPSPSRRASPLCASHPG
ncbi:LysR family transcriptional regulator [Dyella sp. Tek66A03]|uniref:LysR family transcriptional regulator n=1 Tax=Dyella sp. Tek66A03 TaxID=3458298 RepID=UPI00403EC584